MAPMETQVEELADNAQLAAEVALAHAALERPPK